MFKKYLLGLKQYLMRKLSWLISVPNELCSDLHFQLKLWKHDNHMIFYYAKLKQNACSLGLTSLFHHMHGFMWPIDTGKCLQDVDLVLTRQNGQLSKCSLQFRLNCAQIMFIKTSYFQNWNQYVCGFLITSTSSDCMIVKRYCQHRNDNIACSWFHIAFNLVNSDNIQIHNSPKTFYGGTHMMVSFMLTPGCEWLLLFVQCAMPDPWALSSAICMFRKSLWLGISISTRRLQLQSTHKSRCRTLNHMPHKHECQSL